MRVVVAYMAGRRSFAPRCDPACTRECALCLAPPPPRAGQLRATETAQSSYRTKNVQKVGSRIHAHAAHTGQRCTATSFLATCDDALELAFHGTQHHSARSHP